MRFVFLLLLCPVMAFGQAFSFQDLPFLANAGGTDWERRVVANGGAQPTAVTATCMENLRLTLIAQGITNKIHSLCVFVPDSVIAATTPLFKHKGIDPWGNSNFVSGDLNIQGLKGDGTSKSLNPGISNQQAATNGASIERGQTVIISESATNQISVTMGWQEPDANPRDFIQISSNGFSSWFAFDNVGTQNLITNDFARVGYYSGNVVTNASGTNITIYVASPLESHKVISTAIRANAIGVPSVAIDLSVFARNNGTNSLWSAQRLSVAMVNAGFTETESSNVWWALKTCRECLGGGTGDPVYDWNKRMVSYGGTDVSVTTSNALRTFYSGLDTDGTLILMSAANAIVPDNLTAARTPFIWKSGSEIWTNFNFGASNLTVAGLQGNGTDKYLGTGIVPSTANKILATSGGISGIISDNPGTASAVILGGNPVTANVLCDLFVSGGATRTRLWRNDLVNQNFLFANVPSTTWAGYISGNRTAADAIAIYIASSTNTHQVLTNATGTQTGTAAANTTALLTFARNGNGTPADFGNHRVSFVAFHGGLTQTQSSNLYNRASTFRAAVGGGNP